MQPQHNQGSTAGQWTETKDAALSQVPAPCDCYAVVGGDGVIIDIGISVLSAITSAERCLGEDWDDMQAEGYKVEQGCFTRQHNAEHDTRQQQNNQKG